MIPGSVIMTLTRSYQNINENTPGYSPFRQLPHPATRGSWLVLSKPLVVSSVCTNNIYLIYIYIYIIYK